MKKTSEKPTYQRKPSNRTVPAPQPNGAGTTPIPPLSDLQNTAFHPPEKRFPIGSLYTSIVSHLPSYDFSPYTLCVEPLDLVAAIDRAIESNNQELSAYLSLMVFDDAPYCELLTHRRAWTVLATHYGNSGKLDKAEEVIRRAQDPASEVTIDFFDLGALIRLYLGEDEYVRWLYDETRTGNSSAAHALTLSPMRILRRCRQSH